MEGGAEAVVKSFTNCFRNLVMPAFNWGEGSALVAPPPGEALEHNGVDEGFLASLPIEPRPFDAARTPVHPAMGAVPRALHALPGTRRSQHPLASWLAFGPDANELVAGQPWDDPYFPLRRLAERDGWLLLAGVGLTSCTALHLAEEQAGRRSFVRWALRSDGSVGRVRVGGCSDGFGALGTALAGVFRIERCGYAELRAASVRSLLDAATGLFRTQPRLSICRADCIRCRDALGGGRAAAER